MDEVFLANEISMLKARIIELEERVEQASFAAQDPDNNPRNGTPRDTDLWHRWKIEPETDPAALAIGPGRWTRNGIALDFLGGQPAGAWAVGANFIKMRLDSATAPTSITAVVEATGSAVDGTEFVVAVATLAGGVITDISQRRYSDVEDGWATALSVVQTWEGGTCRPVLRAGSFWYLDSVTLAAGVLTLDMQQLCLPMSDQAGYCDATATWSVIDGDGNAMTVNVNTGLVTGVAEGTVLRGINTSTGDAVTLTVQAGGTLSGFTGMVSVINSTTGEASLYRIGSDGKIKQ